MSLYPPRGKTLLYGRQWITDEDVQAVVEVLKGTHLTQGPKIPEFENALKKFTGARYAVAVNSATSGLHIACLAAGVGPGDEVITSPITFVATSNAALYCGAKPVFADIEAETANIDPSEIEKRITPRTRAIIAVHFAGQSCKMKEISEIAARGSEKYGKRIYVIEDASHAIGGSYRGTRVGACEFSDLAITSFHPVKHITTGEGGAVFTKDEKLFRDLSVLRTHGITKEPGELTSQEFMPWGYEQRMLGYNYRMTDLSAALGASQMKRIESFLARRKEIVAKYDAAFSRAGIQTLRNIPDSVNAYHLYVVQSEFKKHGGRTPTMRWLQEQGIQTQVHYIPVHTQPYYRSNLGTAWGDFPKAENYFRKALSIPMHPVLTDEEVATVIARVQEALS